jgi:hypothetical protein
MKSIYNQNSTPKVEFFFGNISVKKDVILLEWNDPIKGFSLVNEQALRKLEEESRLALDPQGDYDFWIYNRNKNYSAEYGLEKLQNYKIKNQIKTDIPLRPVIR